LHLGEVIQLEIPCDTEYLSLARQALVGVARCLQFKPSEIEDMTMAVGEACTNAVRYSHGTRNVKIRCEILRDGMTVEVGNAVGECEFPELPVEPDLDKEGGLGLFIMHALMDEVDLHRVPGYATVRMTKRAKSAGARTGKRLPT